MWVVSFHLWVCLMSYIVSEPIFILVGFNLARKRVWVLKRDIQDISHLKSYPWFCKKLIRVLWKSDSWFHKRVIRDFVKEWPVVSWKSAPWFREIVLRGFVKEWFVVLWKVLHDFVKSDSWFCRFIFKVCFHDSFSKLVLKAYFKHVRSKNIKEI